MEFVNKKQIIEIDPSQIAAADWFEDRTAFGVDVFSSPRITITDDDGDIHTQARDIKAFEFEANEGVLAEALVKLSMIDCPEEITADIVKWWQSRPEVSE